MAVLVALRFSWDPLHVLSGKLLVKKIEMASGVVTLANDVSQDARFIGNESNRTTKLGDLLFLGFT